MAEAKLIKEEAIKQAKACLLVRNDIDRFAREGASSISDDDMVRLKWFGIYIQKPKSDGLFMIRIKIAAGRVSAAQCRLIGQLSQRFGKNLADITTRQTIQLHWLPASSLPEILRVIYEDAGLFQEFSCGDAPRAVTGCPLAGIDEDEIVDTSELALAIGDMYRDNAEIYQDLPRKYKTAVGGCRIHCHLPQINDIAFWGAERESGGHTERGLGLSVGGGLSSAPFMGQSLRVFLPPDVELCKRVAHEIVLMYRDCDDLRLGRRRARFKFHIADVGWQAFRDRLEQRLGFTLPHDDRIDDPVGATGADHLGVGRQKNGLAYVGVPIPRGRLSGDQLVAFAELAERFGGRGPGRVNFTPKQNLVLLDIDPARTDELIKEVEALGFSMSAHALVGTYITCTGSEFCNLAVSETKSSSRRVLEALTKEINLDEPFFVAMTGCPNSCAHYWIGDVGLTGAKVKWNGEMQDAYHLLVGARLGPNPHFAREVVTGEGPKGRLKIPSALIDRSIIRLAQAYKAERQPSDRFVDWAERQDMPRLVELVTPPEYVTAG